MAEILPIRRKTQYNQSINQSIVLFLSTHREVDAADGDVLGRSGRGTVEGPNHNGGVVPHLLIKKRYDGNKVRLGPLKSIEDVIV